MARVGNRSDAYRNIPWWHLRCGDTVYLEDDPRHEGQIISIWNSAIAKVRWEDTGGPAWRSEEALSELVKVGRVR